MTQLPEFGKLLQTHRKAKDLTQADLAKMLELSASYITKLERNDRPPPIATSLKLAAALRLQDKEKQVFLQAANRARAQHLESMDRKDTGRVLTRVPVPPQRIRRPIGRDEVIKSIVDRLAKSVGVINVTGDPAIGKTTVGLEIAHRCWNRGQIVLWGDSREATAESVAQVESLIWNSLIAGQIPDHAAQKQKRLFDALSKYQPLIILDNLESAREFAGILDFARQISKSTSVLITSRRWIPAHIGENIPISELPEDDGIQLFEKVGQAYGRQVVTEKDHHIIEFICVDLLEGHPGAIEIAASLWKGWPLEDVLRGLRHRAMEILEDPHRADINRSMRLSIGLSYDLLHQENVEAWGLLPKLSIFLASFHHQAVEAVIGVSDVLPALEFLVDRSLVRFDGRRHSLHSVVREFGLEKLGNATDEYRLRAARYFLAFAEEHQSHFDHLDGEKGNFFAVIDWAAAHEEHRGIAVDLTDLLDNFMYRRGLWTERVHRTQRALEMAELIGEKEEIARLHYALGDAYRDQGDENNATKHIEKGLALARKMGHLGHIGAGLFSLAVQARRAKDYLQARELGSQTVEFLEQAGVRDHVAPVFAFLGSCERELGHADEARSFFEKGLAVTRQVEDTSLMSILLEYLFRLDIETQDFGNAEERAREYEELARHTDDPLLKGIVLLIWGTLLCETSHPEEAMSYFMAAASHFERVMMPIRAVEAREDLVLAATQLDDLSLAEEQLEAIASIHSDLGNDGRVAFAFYRLGLVQEYLNKPREARTSYEKALSLYSSLGIFEDPKVEEMTSRLAKIVNGSPHQKDESRGVFHSSSSSPPGTSRQPR